MVGNYRQRIDIIADILEVVSLDAKKTQIMFKANLSYKALTKYLSEVLRASLVTYEQDRQCYTLTEKGSDFLNTYKAYYETNKHVVQHLNYLCELCPPEKN
jgi:predicted transcriptional regulator